MPAKWYFVSEKTMHRPWRVIFVYYVCALAVEKFFLFGGFILGNSGIHNHNVKGGTNWKIFIN